jgi:hypothetical protein
MREALNSNILFNTIAMIHSELQSIILVAEGDDDYFLLERHKGDDLYVLPGQGGKANVLEAALKASSRSLKRALFLVDKDYDTFRKPPVVYPTNVLVSKNHDLFMDILEVDAETIEGVIHAHMRGSSRRLGQQISPEIMRRQALELAARIVPIRVANEQHELGLNLSDFPFGGIESLEPSSRKIAEIVRDRSNTKFTSDELERWAELGESELDGASMEFVGDHDFFRALARVLREHGASGISHKILFSSFLATMNFRCASIMGTELYGTLGSWSQKFGMSAFSCPCGDLAA